MKPVTRYSVLAVMFIATVAMAYSVGVAVGRGQSQESADQALASVQLDLGLNHLQRQRELEADLSRGCSDEALAKVRFDIHTQMLVLSSLYKRHKETWVVEKVVKRDSTLPLQLEQFHQTHSSWIEPKCTK